MKISELKMLLDFAEQFGKDALVFIRDNGENLANIKLVPHDVNNPKQELYFTIEEA